MEAGCTTLIFTQEMFNQPLGYNGVLAVPDQIGQRKNIPEMELSIYAGENGIDI